MHSVPYNEIDDLRQEFLMLLNKIFQCKTIKMNRKYYFSVLDYKRKYNTNNVNWNEFYIEKQMYRNKIGFLIIQKYINKSFDNKIKDYFGKEKPILLLNQLSKEGIEYIEYVKSIESNKVNIDKLLLKHIDLFDDITVIIITQKIKYNRKGDCPRFRYITTSG